MTNTALNRTTIVQLTNKSGLDLDQGTIVVLDPDNDLAFDVTTISGYTNTNVGVIFEPLGILNNKIGAVALAGWTPITLVSGGANSGYYLRTSSSAGYAIPFQEAGVGDFGTILQNNSNPEGFLFGNTTQSTGSSGGGTSSEPFVDALTTKSASGGSDVAVGTIVIPANTFAVDRYIRISCRGRIINTTGLSKQSEVWFETGHGYSDILNINKSTSLLYWRTENIIFADAPSHLKIYGTWQDLTNITNTNNSPANLTTSSYDFTIDHTWTVYGYADSAINQTVYIDSLEIEGPFYNR